MVLGSLLWVPQARLFDWRVYDFLSTLWPPERCRRARSGRHRRAIFRRDQTAWPWPRSLHGRLIESLRAAGRKVIALDLVFAEPQDAVQDRLLAQALGPDVVLASTEARLETPQIEGPDANILPLQMFLDTGASAGNTAVN